MLGSNSKEADKDPFFTSLDQTWRNHNPQFHQTSLKYAKKPEYQKTYVGVPWSIVDPTNLVNEMRSPIQSRNSKGLEKAGEWKKFSQFDTMNPHQKHRSLIKDNLRQEINDIALDLALKREATMMFKARDPMI